MIPAAVTRLAAGDLSMVAGAFAAAGYRVQLPARGILQVRLPAAAGARSSLLLSVGIHGDETAPLEMLARILEQFSAAPHSLKVDLLVVVGNPDAIAAGRRFIEVDLNRLFSRQRPAQDGCEVRRAADIMRASAEFFAAVSDAGDARRWHLDLHTAIRASRYPAFAIVPDVNGAAQREAMLAWLGAAGIEAAVLNRQLAATYSAWSALEFGAVACTAELGRVGLLGQNDPAQFATVQAAVADLLAGATPAGHAAPQVFTVLRELIKQSENFRLNLDAAAANFTPLAAGAEIARDGELVYRVGSETEFVLFPNPSVAPGQRAALMLRAA